MKIQKIILICLLFSPLFSDIPENNDFYDNTKTFSLTGPEIRVCGEIKNPGKVDFSGLRLRSVIVREAVFKDDKPAFVGSYRYDGYSLFDILKEFYVDKKNQAEFNSVIDLLVLVENQKGEKAVFTWGEIYYPTVLHRILIATRMARIVPSKTGEQWPIGKNTKLVCAQDLVSERNVEHPVRITIFSAPVRLKANKSNPDKDLGKIGLFQSGQKIREIINLEPGLENRTYPSVFYGRGRGFHGIQYFRGSLFKSLLQKDFKFNKKNIQSGYFMVAAVDGYRIAVSFSELFNRNDQTDFLIIDNGKDSGKGRFRLFPAADFFSDRAIYAINSIYFFKQ
jgi:hypothetical protein